MQITMVGDEIDGCLMRNERGGFQKNGVFLSSKRMVHGALFVVAWMELKTRHVSFMLLHE